MSKPLNTTIKRGNFEELDNVKRRFIKKAEELNLSIPELSEFADISYKSIWRLMNDNNLPTYKILDKIASFLKISVAELLSTTEKHFNNIPIIELNEVQMFLKNRFDDASNSYLEEGAFAIQVNNGKKNESIYIFKPSDKMIKGVVVLQNNDKFILAKIFEIINECIKFSDLSSDTDYSYQLNADDIKVFAIAVKKVITSKLI